MHLPVPSYGPRKSLGVTPAKAAAFRYTSYYPPKPRPVFYRLPNMVGLSGVQMSEGGFGAVKASTVAQGASYGSVAGPWGTAIGAAVGAVAGLVSGKAHYSPWNFLYDDYPEKIYQNEIQLNQIRNAIAQYSGAPQVADPPMYSKKGGPQYQASMLAIVPKYQPGSESQIAAYDRRLNEAGGAYENTVKAQIALAPQLQQQLSYLQQTQRPSGPATGSATSIAPYTPPQAVMGPPQQSPYPISYQPPPLMPQLQPGPTMLPSYQPGSAPQLSDLFGGSMGQYMPYILGAIGLAAILFTQSGGGGTRTVYRSRPRRR